MQVQLTQERQAQLAEYAKRHGQDPDVALDGILAEALDWEMQDYRDAVEAIREGYADVRAGKTKDSEEVFEELRAKYGFSR